MKDGLTPSKIDQWLAKIKPQAVVALVDDDLATLDLLGRALTDEGFAVHRFQTAEDFLQHLSDVKPDAVVMEVVLPGMSGLSVLEELRPKSPEEVLPILILSQKEDPRTKLLAFRRGASDYVLKPFDAAEVAARVRSLVRGRLLQEAVLASSVYDPLTSIYNRRFLLVWLEREMERVKRQGLELSCLWVDLDGFHEINEKKGEAFGDFLLKEFAGLVTQNTRSCDIVGRIQNDEFLIFLPGTSKEQAACVVRRLRENARKETHPTFCVGIMGCQASEASDPVLFLGRAEEALMKAKAVGQGETAVLGVS